jgi:general stress protein YciG
MPKGFAAMSPELQRALASKGGRTAHLLGRGYEFTSEKAREAGRLGGTASRGGHGKPKTYRCMDCGSSRVEVQTPPRSPKPRPERLVRVSWTLRCESPRVVRWSPLNKHGVHILHHTFCSRLAMSNAPMKSIQELAGHADLSTKMRYMHLSPALRDGAIKLLERGNSGETEISLRQVTEG